MKAHVSDESRAPAGSQGTELGKPTPQHTAAPSRSGAAAWLVPAVLILLSAIPIAAGVFRLTQLAGGAAITPANARFFASPLPVALHIVSVTLYSLLGAFQFVPSLRHRRRGWHRAAGRIAIPSGLLAALSGLWMTLFGRLPAYDGGLVYGLRLLFGLAMLFSLLLGVVALRRRDFAQHGGWMLRGYAIGLGAGTQVLTGFVAALIADPPTEHSRALMLGAGWAINLAVAEWIIRTRPARPPRKQPLVPNRAEAG
ncbi:MAG TPA: DUF2306 domain-containing protein [Roseiflexaceae bacterium]|nr:DUF2306 domain-containing protein [Roseiflexaceae bacterium]